jgi:opacity protein-like surface antigen
LSSYEDIYGLAVPAISGSPGSANNASGALSLTFGKSFVFNDRLLFGLEVEVSYARAVAEVSEKYNLFGNAYLKGYSTTDIVMTTTTMDWSGEFRERLGYIASPDLVVYTAIGPAVGFATAVSQHVRNGYYTQICPLPGIGCHGYFYNVSENLAGGAQKALSEISLGAGVDYRIATNVTLRVEYNYYRFSPLNVSISDPDASHGPDLFKVTPVLQTARLGVQYHF